LPSEKDSDLRLLGLESTDWLRANQSANSRVAGCNDGDASLVSQRGDTSAAEFEAKRPKELADGRSQARVEPLRPRLGIACSEPAVWRQPAGAVRFDDRG